MTGYLGSLPAPRPVGVPVVWEGAARGQSWRWRPRPCLGEAGGWGWAPVQGYGEVQEGGHQLWRVAAG